MNPIKIEIPKEMFSPAEMMSVSEDVCVEPIELGPDTYTFPKPLHWDIHITNTGNAFLVTGSVEGEGSTSCARCLDEALFEFAGEIEGYFVMAENTDDLDEDIEEDEYEVIGEDKAIDVAPLIENAIILSIPRIPLCSDDCKGLCPVCGANLNDGDCSCDVSSDSDDLSNPFSVLKDFKF